MKKFLSLFIFVLCVALNANAQSGTLSTGLKWELNNGVLTISGEGEMPDFTSGSETEWYSSRKNITSVVVEDGVTNIGDYAFFELQKVKRITIPASVKCLGYEAFGYCNVLSEIFWYGEGLDGFTFEGDLNEDVTISEVFSGLTLAEIVLYHKSSAAIAMWCVDEELKFMSGILGDGDNLSWVLFDGKLTITGEGSTAFAYQSAWDVYRTKITSVSLTGVAADVSGSYVLSNDGKILYFSCSNGDAVIIPEGVEVISTKAFYKLSNITSLVIASSVTTINDYAFDGCTKITTVSALPAVAPTLGVTKVFSSLIKGKAKVVVENGEVDNYQEKGWSKYFNNIDKEITTSGEYNTSGTWNYDKDTHVLSVNGATIPDYSVSAEQAPWYDILGLVVKIVIGDKVASIGENAFISSSATTVSIASSVKSISDFAFAGVAADFTFGNNSAHSDDAINVSKTKSLKIVEVNRGDYTSADDLFVESTTNTYDNITLVRSFANGKSGTIILPFDYIDNSGLTFYEIASFNSSSKSIVFDEVLSLKANTPYLWRNNSGYNISEISVSGEIELKPLEMQGEHSVTVGTGNNAWTMYGLYAEEKVFPTEEGENSDLWVFNSKGAFDNYSDFTWVDPYRAYFKGSRYSDVFPGTSDKNSINGITNGRSLSVEFNNIDGTTSIEGITIDQDGNFETVEDGAYYDLSGRRVENPTSGIYIVNGKKVLVK